VDTGQWSVPDDVIDDNDVQFVPVFQPTPRNVNVSLGDRAVLRCRVDNLGTRTVRQVNLTSFASRQKRPVTKNNLEGYD